MGEVHLHSLRDGGGSVEWGFESLYVSNRRVCGFKPGHVFLGLSDFGLE